MKKRILAIVLSIVMILGAMSFSAFAAPETSYASGLNDSAYYLMKIPEGEQLGKSNVGYGYSYGSHFAGPIRLENGERFVVFNEEFVSNNPSKYDGALINSNAWTPVIKAPLFTYEEAANGLPASIPMPTTGGVEDASTLWIALRIKINDNGDAFEKTTSALRLYVKTASDNLALSGYKKAAKWLDLEDGSMTWFYADSGYNYNGSAELHFTGDMDGYLMLPIANTGVTAEALRSGFSGFGFRFYTGNTATSGKKIKESSWKDKELLIGDAFLVSDPVAFQTARTQGITKYAPNDYEDTAYYAFRVGGYRTLYYGLNSKSSATHYDKNKYDPTLAGTNDRALLHTTTLTNGDRAVEIIVNKQETDPTKAVEYEGKTVALTAWDTYDHFRDGTEGNYRMQTGKGLPAEISKDKIKYVAFRLATKDGTVADETCYFNISIGEQNDKSTGYPICYYLKSDTDYTFIDINTDKVSKISTTSEKGLKVDGEIDGYLIVPIENFVDDKGDSISLDEIEESYGFYPNNERPSATVKLYDGFGNGKALYYGDTYFVADATKFQQYHCSHTNWTDGTVVAPTCKDEGYTPSTCDDCGKVKNKDLKPIVACEYTVPVPAQQPSCTEYGFDSAYKCRWCGEIDHATMVNPQNPVPHNSDLYCVEVPSTCKDTGTTEGYRCSICQEPQTGCDEIPLREHSSLEKSEKVVFDEIPATCKSTGIAAGYKCPWCEEVLEGCETIPIADHNKVDEVPEVPATCTTEGVSIGYKCSWCGELQEGCTPTEKIDHNKEINVPKVPTSCQASGTTEGKKCSMCGELQEGCTEIAKLEHNFSQIGTIAPTIDEEGYDLYKCADCNYEEPRNFVDMLSEGGDADDDEQQDNDDDQNEGQVGDGEDGESEGNIDDDQGNSGSESSGDKTPITGEEVVFLIVMIVICLGAAAVLFVTKKRANK